MALKNAKWALVALVPVLILVAALPPRACPGSVNFMGLVEATLCGYWGRGYAGRPGPHWVVVENAAAGVERELERRQLIAAAVRAQPSARSRRVSDGDLSLLVEGVTSDDSARAWLRLARTEIEELPAGATPGGRVVIVVLADSTGPLAVATRNDRSRFGDDIRRLANDAEGRPTCWVILDRTRGYGRGGVSFGDNTFVGWCALVARYGVPGERVGRIAQGGYWGYGRGEAIGRTVLSARIRGREGSARSYAAHSRKRSWQSLEERRDYLGPDREPLACADGDRAACASMLGLSGGRPLATRRLWRQLFLVDLLAFEPTERFTRFWQSDGTFDEALAEAYGASAPEVVHQWAKQRFDLRWSPAPSRGQALAALGWLGLALGLAAVAGSRRLMR